MNIKPIKPPPDAADPNMAKPQQQDRINRKPYSPPKNLPRRDGAFDFQAWPSKGGD